MDTTDWCFLIKSFQVILDAFSFLLGDGNKFSEAFLFRHARSKQLTYDTDQ